MPSVRLCGWGKPLVGQASNEFAEKEISAEKVGIIEKYCLSFAKSCDKEEEWWKEFCTDDCEMTVPGAPPMPLSQLNGMFAVWKKAFPDWESKVFIPKGQANAAPTIVHTQQIVGKMQHDLPAAGPFPGITMADASDRIKNKGMTLPFEQGEYTFNEAGDKIAKIVYGEDSVVRKTDKEHKKDGANTMDLTPPVGVPSIYACAMPDFTLKQTDAGAFELVKNE